MTVLIKINITNEHLKRDTIICSLSLFSKLIVYFTEYKQDKPDKCIILIGKSSLHEELRSVEQKKKWQVEGQYTRPETRRQGMQGTSLHQSN